ncbi:MAG: Hsp20/alpha crystallin family protein [Spirochaetales bacterium]|nr:Hsp20/alpha crystallin family protein [Spirochaetales bacterium]MCF7938540.1 Hsp20/alpha crystallin family protein [Spirochaetales bacterium]
MATETKDIQQNQQAKKDETRRSIRPVGNIFEEKDAVVLRLEMPGVSKDDLEINVDGDMLNITGHRNPYAEDVGYIVHERADADFRAAYTLDQRIDREKIEAQIERGVLTVKLKLKDEVKPRKIEVKGE